MCDPHPRTQKIFGGNAVWALAEVGVSSATLFLLYRLVTDALGIKALGLWSLVLATTSLARFGDVGASAGLSRFVAIADAEGGIPARHYVETALLSTLALYLGMSLLLFWPLRYVLTRTLHPDDVEAAIALLPLALISFTLAMTSASATTGLIGQHRTDQKSQLGIIGLVLQLAIAASLMRAYGLAALAWAQIAQNLWLLFAGWVLFARNATGRWSLRPPCCWRRPIFDELIGFGSRLQAANLISFLFEPLTKFVMSSLVGLEALGLYEMANRMVLLARQVIVAPMQTLIPAFAAGRHAPLVGSEIYRKAFALVLPASLSINLGLALAAPVISTIWIGHADARFVFFMGIMSVGWFANTIASPAYLLGVGYGFVRWNIIGHLMTSLGGPALSLLLGQGAQARGVAIGASVMLAIGSLASMVMNCRHADLNPFVSLRLARTHRPRWFWPRWPEPR